MQRKQRSTAILSRSGTPLRMLTKPTDWHSDMKGIKQKRKSPPIPFRSGRFCVCLLNGALRKTGKAGLAWSESV